MRIEASPRSIDFATLELLPLGVIVVDAKGTVLFYNHREEEISGMRREAVIGTSFFHDVAPCTEVKSFFGRFQELMATGGETVAFDFTFPFALGPRHVHINLHPFRKDDENLCVIFVSDLSAQAILRQKLLQNQHFSELGEVAAKVAHNFNNILQVVEWGAQLAQDSEPEAARGYLKQVQAAVADGGAMVRRFQQIAKTGLASAAVPFDLNEAVALAVGFAGQVAEAALKEDGRRVKLRMNPAQGALRVLGDGAEFREALFNLLRNAVEAIPVEGTVRVITTREAGWIILDIIDDGTGMDLETQHKVFTPMFTTKGDRGNGLGLASVHATVCRHGGTIDLHSMPGKGTHFRIGLPEAAAREQP